MVKRRKPMAKEITDGLRVPKRNAESNRKGIESHSFTLNSSPFVILALLMHSHWIALSGE
jgi:hypothetical protein